MPWVMLGPLGPLCFGRREADSDGIGYRASQDLDDKARAWPSGAAKWRCQVALPSGAAKSLSKVFSLSHLSHLSPQMDNFHHFLHLSSFVISRHLSSSEFSSILRRCRRARRSGAPWSMVSMSAMDGAGGAGRAAMWWCCDALSWSDVGNCWKLLEWLMWSGQEVLKKCSRSAQEGQESKSQLLKTIQKSILKMFEIKVRSGRICLEIIWESFFAVWFEFMALRGTRPTRLLAARVGAYYLPMSLTGLRVLTPKAPKTAIPNASKTLWNAQIIQKIGRLEE